MSLDELYQELLLDHFKHPRCHGAVENPDAQSSLRNPLCGDHIDLSVKLAGAKISEIKFLGKGCSISQASASLMSEYLQGKTVVEARAALDKFRGLMQGSGEANISELGDIAALAGVRKFSARIRCALLAWEALEQCLKK
jgi:nitrogen fixation NifU-like protein